jgi:hypothetical protein
MVVFEERKLLLCKYGPQKAVEYVEHWSMNLMVEEKIPLAECAGPPQTGAMLRTSPQGTIVYG